MGLSVKFGSLIIWGLKNILFKCDWVDDRWVNVDELGFTVINLDPTWEGLGTLLVR